MIITKASLLTMNRGTRATTNSRGRLIARAVTEMSFRHRNLSITQTAGICITWERKGSAAMTPIRKSEAPNHRARPTRKAPPVRVSIALVAAPSKL